MILRVEELQEFFKLSSTIKTNLSRPELQYLYIGNGIIRKTNLAIDCVMKIATDDALHISYLVDEKLLQNLVKSTFKTEIKVFTKDNKIIISDEKNHLSHGYVDIDSYPSLRKKPAEKGLPVPKSVIDTISVARAFCSGDENATNFRCVSFKDNYIFAIDFNKFYLKCFPFKFPEAMLLSDYCDIITQFMYATFWDTETYFYYEFGIDISFCFSKLEFKVQDISQRIDVLENKITGDKFTISKKDIVNFCDIANNLTPSKQTVCILKQDEKLGAIIYVEDIDYTKGFIKEIISGGSLSDFAFNSKITTSAFKALPQEEFDCIVMSNTLVIKDKDSWACFSGTQIQTI